MEIISLVLAYLMVGCTVSTALYVLSDNYDFALYFGLIWPLGVPLFIVAFITCFIYRLLCKIIEFIKKTIEKKEVVRKNKKR